MANLMKAVKKLFAGPSWLVSGFSNDEKEGALKLESHKITNFSGKSEDWPKWKSATK